MKRAVLIGINYIGTQNELAGCINDIDKIEKLLRESFGYTDITRLTDLTETKPTKANILAALAAMIAKSRLGDEIVFYYSGHGTATCDTNKDELDGQDEALCAVDGFILDDELFPIIAKTKAKLYMFIDACHSGTMVDLEYNWRPVPVAKHFIMSLESKITNAPVIMFSGCLDPQTSTDASFKRTDNEYEANGAFTYCLLELIAENKGYRNREIISKIHEKLIQKRFQQIPQLSCSRINDFNSVFLR